MGTATFTRVPLTAPLSVVRHSQINISAVRTEHSTYPQTSREEAVNIGSLHSKADKRGRCADMSSCDRNMWALACEPATHYVLCRPSLAQTPNAKSERSTTARRPSSRIIRGSSPRIDGGVPEPTGTAVRAIATGVLSSEFTAAGVAVAAVIISSVLRWRAFGRRERTHCFGMLSGAYGDVTTPPHQ